MFFGCNISTAYGVIYYRWSLELLAYVLRRASAPSAGEQAANGGGRTVAGAGGEAGGTDDRRPTTTALGLPPPGLSNGGQVQDPHCETYLW